MESAFALAVPATVLAGLGVEQRLFAPGREARRGEAVAGSARWLILAIAVPAGIALAGGPASQWTAVYLIERSLSLDNVFLFSLLLAYFVMPAELRARVILFGIAGASRSWDLARCSLWSTSSCAASATSTRRSLSSSRSSG